MSEEAEYSLNAEIESHKKLLARLMHNDGGSDLGVDQIMRRSRGILSKVDRAYLFGEREFEYRQSELNRQQDIRERVVDSLQDFILLETLLSEKQRHKIFDEEIENDILNTSIKSFVSFVYSGLNKDTTRLENIIESGVFAASKTHTDRRLQGEVTNVDVSIDIYRTPDIDELYEKLQQGDIDSLTDSDIGMLVRSGKLDSQDLEKLETVFEPKSSVDAIEKIRNYDNYNDTNT